MPAQYSSRLTQARGLKHNIPLSCLRLTLSRLTQARGLKPFATSFVLVVLHVAPHAGAWIETSFLVFLLLVRYVAPHAGAWIETTTMPAMQLK